MSSEALQVRLRKNQVYSKMQARHKTVATLKHHQKERVELRISASVSAEIPPGSFCMSLFNHVQAPFLKAQNLHCSTSCGSVDPGRYELPLSHGSPEILGSHGSCCSISFAWLEGSKGGTKYSTWCLLEGGKGSCSKARDSRLQWRFTSFFRIPIDLF